jgi:plasmid stability protein
MEFKRRYERDGSDLGRDAAWSSLDITRVNVISSLIRRLVMADIAIRKLNDETHRALKQRAAQHGRSTEAEIRSILDAAVRPEERRKLGSELAALAQKYGGFDLEIERDRSPIQPAVFE